MKAKTTMVAWTPAAAKSGTAGKMIAVPFPENSHHAIGYQCSDLACWARVAKMTRKELEHLCLHIFVIATVRAPEYVHGKLCDIEEYRSALERHPARTK